jgi:hypothetical protein
MLNGIASNHAQFLLADLNLNLTVAKWHPHAGISSGERNVYQPNKSKNIF